MHASTMYIRRTKTKTAEHGEDSFTYRIVESVREGTQVKQRTLLNLGKDFAIEPAHWPLLAARIEQLLQGSAPRQAELFTLADEVGQLLEAAAERYSTLIIAKLTQPLLAVATPEQDYHSVDINYIEASQARSIGAETKETRLYCYSDQKAKKEQAIRNRFHVRLEGALNRLNVGLGKKGTIKNVAKIHERIGRLREKNSRVAQDYRIEVIADDKKNNAIRIDWQRESKSTQKDQHCGVYCLRTNIPDWSEQQLWTTYIMLTEIEATFRSLKTDLGLRPVFHHKEDRVTGHLFITLLAYHLVHTLRYQLKQQGIHFSWDSIRNLMSTQQRITLTLPTDDNKTIHLRTTTQAEARLKQLYTALSIKPDPLGKSKTIIDNKKSVVPFEIN